MEPRNEMSRKIQKVREFIIDNHGGSCSFGDTDDLIDCGLIDSLRFMDFVLLIEELSGIAIPIDGLDIEQFRTIENISKSFFAAGTVQ
jgi:acyl carrier protein